MLISFSVANFRSFGEEATLNMVAHSRINDHKTHVVPLPLYNRAVLRSAVIYGANAAGKSNLIKAMKFAQQAVSGADRTVSPFRFSGILMNKPSSFEFRFSLSGSIFAYGFDISSAGIESEWLQVLKPDETPITIFERNAEGISKSFEVPSKLVNSDSKLNPTLEKLCQIPLTKKQLLLNRMTSLPDEFVGPTLSGIMRWILRDLVLLDAEFRTNDLMARLSSDTKFREFCAKFLNSVGTGICNLQIGTLGRQATEWEAQFLRQGIKEGSARVWGLPAPELSDTRPDPKDPKRVIERTLFAQHLVERGDAKIPFYDESDGTKKLLHLMPLLYPTEGHAKVVVLDELDRSLHPLICREIIKHFSES